jgi:uncharacterized protein YjbI with pentapeptide repeats
VSGGRRPAHQDQVDQGEILGCYVRFIVDFQNDDIQNVNFQNDDFQNVYFQNDDFQNVCFQNANITYYDLSYITSNPTYLAITCHLRGPLAPAEAWQCGGCKKVDILTGGILGGEIRMYGIAKLGYLKPSIKPAV